MKKIIFCFAGAGDPGDYYADQLEKGNIFGDDVIRVYFRGCQHDKVGGSFLLPNLDIAADNIRSAFNEHDQTIDLKVLLMRFNDGICQVVNGPLENNNPQIESIGLHGFSRGAVTTFAVAKKLDDLNIPLDIIANQPVPGQSTSLYSTYGDLTQCKNIRLATTFLASHNLENGIIHDSFYQQMVAKFPSVTKVNNWIMPHQTHLEWSKYQVVAIHINKQFEESGYATDPWGKTVGRNEILMSEYMNYDLCFTPKELSQEIFGAEGANIIKDPIYLERIKESAKELLIELSIELPNGQELNDEQANAILAFIKVKTLNEKEINEFMNFSIKDNDKAKKFIEIINKIDEIIEYLNRITKVADKTVAIAKHSHPYFIEIVNKIDEIAEYLTQTKVTGETISIAKHSHHYKKEMFSKSYRYLSKAEATTIDKKEFKDDINRISEEFENKLFESKINIDRSIVRNAMKLTINSLLHITDNNTTSLLSWLEQSFWSNNDRKILPLVLDTKKSDIENKGFC